MTSLPKEPYLKYAIFCRSTDEGSEGKLILNDVVDLIDLPKLPEPIDLNLAFCIAGGVPGAHHLMVVIKGPGMRLAPPPIQEIDWEEGILFQRWIKEFRIPIQHPGLHVAAILLDGTPLGEGSFLVRLQDESS